MKVKILLEANSTALEQAVQELLDGKGFGSIEYMEFLVLPSSIGCVVVYKEKNEDSSDDDLLPRISSDKKVS